MGIEAGQSCSVCAFLNFGKMKTQVIGMISFEFVLVHQTVKKR